MARTGITYEQLVDAAESLMRAGKVGADGFPTIEMLRAVIGGAPKKIIELRNEWKARLPAPAPEAAEMPAGIVRAIRDEIERVSQAVRQDYAGRLQAAETDAAELAALSTEREIEADQLRTQIQLLTTERDQLAGQSSEQQREIERLRETIDKERAESEHTRVELAKARLKADGDAELLKTLRQESQQLRSDLDQERRQHIEAARKLAASESALAQAREQLADLTATRAEQERTREQLQTKLDAEREAHAAARNDLAAANAREKAAADRAVDLEGRERVLREELAALRSPKQDADDKPIKERSKKE